MSTITNSLRPYFAGRCQSWGTSWTPSAVQEARFLFGAALIGLVCGAVVVLHALSAVTAFQ
jgi:hypothetical protein